MAQEKEGETLLLYQLASASKVADISTIESILQEHFEFLYKFDDLGLAPIHHAADAGQTEIVLNFIKRGIDIDFLSKNGATPLHCSCYWNQTETALTLIKMGADINIKTKTCVAPLMWAAGAGCTEIVLLLLEKGADVESSNELGMRPIHYAAKHGFPKIVEILMEHGAEINTRDNDGNTALIAACKEGHVEVAALLYARDSTLVGHVDNVGDPAILPKPRIIESSHPLVYTIDITEYIPVETPGAHGYLVEFDDSTATDKRFAGFQFLKYRSRFDRWGEEMYFGSCSTGDENYPGVNGRPPLHIPVDKFTICFQSGRRSNLWGYKMKVTPLYLLENSTSNGWTPLIWAAYMNKKETVSWLLQDVGHGLDSHGWDGNTALAWAVDQRFEDVSVLLIRAGARFDIKNKEGMTALEAAVAMKQHSVVSAMIQHFHPIRESDDGGIIQDGSLFVWHFILSETQFYVNDVNDLLDRYSGYITVLAGAVDSSGRRSVDIARPHYKKAIMERLYMFKRYELLHGRPEHTSTTCILWLAKDHGVEPTVEVALKFMRDKTQFARELSMRSIGNFDEDFIISTLRCHDSEMDNDFREECEKKGLYPFCIVMPCADRNLAAVLMHDHIAGRDWDRIRAIALDVLKCIQHLHMKRIIHADVKTLNVVLMGGMYKLIDLDASVPIREGSYSCVKYSSAYLPPELLAIVNREILVRSCVTDSITGNGTGSVLPYELVPASESHDMWSFGVVLYQLCTGEPLFKANDEDNLDPRDLKELYNWSDEFKDYCLSKVKDPRAKNLIARLLSKDPSLRPDTAHVLAHPFFTGQATGRMVGEDPTFDVFISYRVAADLEVAEAIYEVLTRRSLRVWFDKECLEDGKRWEESFCDGLVESAVFLPLVSKRAINSDTVQWQNFSRLRRDSSCDNVLLEHRLALQLKEMRLIEAVFPVLIGETADQGDVRTRTYTMFDQFPSRLALPDTEVTAVENKLREHLDRQGLGAPLNENATVKEVYSSLMSYQGGFLEGSGGSALDALAAKVWDIADKIGSKKLPPPIDNDHDELKRLQSETKEQREEIDRLCQLNSTLNQTNLASREYRENTEKLILRLKLVAPHLTWK